MTNVSLELFLFASKAILIVILILLLVLGIMVIIGRGREKTTGRLTVKNINKRFSEMADQVRHETLTKKALKKFLKDQKAEEKKKSKSSKKSEKNIYLLSFQGDIKGSAVTSLREEITAILSVATKNDEVVVCVESAGGMVHAYGLGASQLMRVRKQNIPLTVIVDKVAASGGYMMASVANKIISAPFAIIGSIGVIFQLPNFHRFLQDKHIDFEQVTAGSYKRTLTLFGHNTKEGREKLQQEMEDVHQLFKTLIQDHRPDVNIEKVSTGEYWLGSQALDLKLVDELGTSDDYLLSQSKHANLYHVQYHVKKSWAEKLSGSASALVEKYFR